MKNMPVGVDDFEEIIAKNYYFVDKTRFIKELLDKQAKVTLITRPRRFGKTINLSMLNYFFNLDNAAVNRALFVGLYIERAGERYMREQGTRPVIFLTFKDIKYNTWSGALKKIASGVAELYKKYLFLAESAAINEFDREEFFAVCRKQAEPTDLEDAVAKLCKMLYLHYGKKPVVLIDEYDTPILSAWHHCYYDDCMQFMRNFFGAALKNNSYLDFAVLTGITRIAKENIFSGLNNLAVCGILAESYADCFGFTPTEAENLMQDSNYAGKIAELKQWYDGYKFGRVEIYNPWSVINFVADGCKFRPYWINVAENAVLRDMLCHLDSRRQMDLAVLMRGESVQASINEHIVYADLAGDRDALYMLLLHTGYLKAIDSREYQDGVVLVRLTIPNREIRQAYRQEILRHTAPQQGITLLQEMLEAMSVGDTDVFSEKLSQVLLDNVSFYDTVQPEIFYHGLLLGFAVLTEGLYRVESNRESGHGRFDIAFFPLDKNRAGVIWELKAVKTVTDLPLAAKKALEQIKQNMYVHELERQGVENIWQYGISVCGKKIYIERG